MSTNPFFELQGFGQITWICANMERTVAFYNGLLGMPIVRGIERDDGVQEVTFDIGSGQEIGFVWDPAGCSVESDNGVQWDGGTHHVSITIELSRVQEYWQRLREHGIEAAIAVFYLPGTRTADEFLAATNGGLGGGGAPILYLHGRDSYANFPSTHPNLTIADLDLTNPDILGVELTFKDPDGVGLEFSHWLETTSELQRTRSKQNLIEGKSRQEPL